MKKELTKKFASIAVVLILTLFGGRLFAFGTDATVGFTAGSQNVYAKSKIAIATNGWIYAASYNSNTKAIEIYKSTDGGHNFSLFRDVKYLNNETINALDISVGMINATTPKVILATAIFNSGTGYSGVWADMWEDNGTTVPHTYKELINRGNAASNTNNFLTVSITTDMNQKVTVSSPFSVLLTATLRSTYDSAFIFHSIDGAVMWSVPQMYYRTLGGLYNPDVSLFQDATGQFAYFATIFIENDSLKLKIGTFDSNGPLFIRNMTLPEKIQSATIQGVRTASGYNVLGISYQLLNSSDIKFGFCAGTTTNQLTTSSSWQYMNIAATSAIETDPQMVIVPLIGTVAPNAKISIVYQTDSNIYQAEASTTNLNWTYTKINDIPTQNLNYKMTPAIAYDAKNLRNGIVWVSNNKSGVFATSNFFFDATKDVTTGIDNLEKQNLTVVMYPNPANTVLKIETKEDISDATIYIHNMLGQEVINVKAIDSKLNQFDVSSLGIGNYILTIVSEKYIAKQNLLITK